MWYRWQVEQRGEGSHSRDLATSLLDNFFYWPESSETSQTHFDIKDSTGAATIFPDQAEIIVAQRQVWYDGNRRYTEERILPGDALYVLGEFSTHNPG